MSTNPNGLRTFQVGPDERKKVEKCVRAVGKHVKTYFDIYALKEHYENGHVWAAAVGAGPEADAYIGFAVASPLKRTHVTSLYEFGILPEFRGLGFGRELLEAARVDRPLRLVVDHDNPAVEFYRHLGLVPTTDAPYTTRSGKNVVWKFEGEPK